MHKRTVLTSVAALAFAAPLGATAQQPDEFRLGDVIEVIDLGDELVAADARSGGPRSVQMKPNEKILWTGSRGKVGVGLTSYRVLATSAGSAAWKGLFYTPTENRPDSALLGDRLALVVTDHRVIGFNSRSGDFVENKLNSTEKLVAIRVGENVGVVVTTHRALGFSPVAGGFFETRMRPRERISAITANATFATITTEHRVRVFRAPTGTWKVTRRQ